MTREPFYSKVSQTYNPASSSPQKPSYPLHSTEPQIHANSCILDQSGNYLRSRTYTVVSKIPESTSKSFVAATRLRYLAERACHRVIFDICLHTYICLAKSVCKLIFTFASRALGALDLVASYFGEFFISSESALLTTPS